MAYEAQRGLRGLLVDLCIVASLLVVPGLLPASAASANVVVTPHLRAELVSDVASIQPGERFWVALHFSLAPGWHTYWMNPGDSGSPPTVAWELPEGFTASAIQWPYPQRIPVGPLMNFGYLDEAWMLVRMTPPAHLTAGQPLRFVVRAEWLVCKEECIPESGTLSLALPVATQGAVSRSPWHEELSQLQQRLPQALPWPASLTVDQDRLELQVAVPTGGSAQLSAAWFFPAEYGSVEHAADQPLRIDAAGLALGLTRGDLRSQPLESLTGVLVVTEQLPSGPVGRAFAIDVPAVATAANGTVSLTTALVFALLGGILLNVMPCVFPVLSMKALALVRQSQHQAGVVRRDGVAFTAGVLASFALVAGALMVLRAGGAAVGWGFQLQSPAFVLALAWVIFALGLMLSGVWSFGARLMGLGDQLTTGGGYGASFFTGVLAVVVATPCTAPFMGVALGFALTQPTVVALSVFLALGLGLSLPWLVLSVWPAAQRWLPRPGPWMERLRQFLAFPMYATVVWLVWILAQQTNALGVAVALGGMVVIGLVAWLWQLTRSAAPIGRMVGSVTAVLGFAVLLAGMSSVHNAGAGLGESAATQSRDWQPFSRDRLATFRKAGRPVFVNFTAAWCVTCLLNERIALSSEAVRQAMQTRDVAYLKGDWTRRDPEITRMLERFGRSGVPLYLLYPADGTRAPQVLPPLLTEGLLLERLERL